MKIQYPSKESNVLKILNQYIHKKACALTITTFFNNLPARNDHTSKQSVGYHQYLIEGLEFDISIFLILLFYGTCDLR